MIEQHINIPKLRFHEFDGEWVREKLGDVANVSAGGTPSTLKEEYWNGTIRWMNSGELNLKRVYEVENRITEKGLKNSSTKLIPKFCILIGLAGQGKTRGTVAMNMIELCTNQSIASIYPYEDSFHSDFLYHNLDNRYEELRSLSTGDGGRGGLNLHIIKSLILNLPSVPEQQKIASFFTSIDQKLSQLKQKKTLLEQYKKGVMQKIFSQEIRFKDDNNKEFPKWKKNKFSQIYSFRVTNFFSREDLNYKKGDVKNIHYGDIHTKFQTLFDVTKEDVPFINPDLSIKRISSDNYCKTSDIIFADASEDLADVGKSIELVNLNNEKVLAGLHTILARPDITKIASGFGGYLMKSNDVRKQIMKIAQGSKITSISSTRLCDINLNIPCPAEQTKIANFLSAIDEKISNTQKKIEKTEIWKKGLLQKMFV